MGNKRSYVNRFNAVHQELGMQLNQKGYFEKPKASKYKNKKCEYDGIVFDSKKEMLRYCELLGLQKQGKIKELEYHKVFELIPHIRTTEELVRAVNYECDLFYYDNALNNYVVEDVKCEFTKKLSDYVIKKKLMLSKYPQYTFFENSKIKKYYRVICGEQAIIKKELPKTWLDVLKSINRTEVLQKIADKCRLPISVIISIKMEVYKANDTIEKNIINVLKEMGLIC